MNTFVKATALSLSLFVTTVELFSIVACDGCKGTGGVTITAQAATDLTGALACNLSHWGEPFQQIASDCWANDLQAAADGLAEIELLFEKQTDTDAGTRAVAGVQARFPYGNEPAVVESLAKLRAQGQ